MIWMAVRCAISTNVGARVWWIVCWYGGVSTCEAENDIMHGFSSSILPTSFHYVVVVVVLTNLVLIKHFHKNLIIIDPLVWTRASQVAI